MAELTPVGRFAPTPSGRMHLGNVFAALMAWLSVRSRGGEMVLRMEDLDTQRTSVEFAEILRDDLRWLGLTYDRETPAQSTRSSVYDTYFEKLQAMGLLYPCYCTRRELHAAPTEASAPHAAAPVYSGRCRHLTDAMREDFRAQGRRGALRIIVPDRVYSVADRRFGVYSANLAREVGDFILRRSDGLYAYQLAVVADDAAMGVTEVVRGRDLLPSAPQQLYLQEVLGFPHPNYAHLPLLLAPDGRRLSKREGDLSIRALSKRYKPTEVVGILAHSAGLIDRPTPVTPTELVGEFSWSRVPTEDIVIPLHAL